MEKKKRQRNLKIRNSQRGQIQNQIMSHSENIKNSGPSKKKEVGIGLTDYSFIG